MSQAADARIDHWGRADRQGFAGRLFGAAYRHWLRVEWEGLEHVPREGGALLVGNHAGVMPVDGGVIQYGIMQELGRPVYGLAHHGFFRLPFLGTALARFGGVVGHPANAQRLLRDEGRLVLVFPEGAKGPAKPPRERYRLQRFGRGGFVESALRAGVPIVPIALLGTEDTTPTLATVRLGAGLEGPINANMLLLGPLGAMAPLPAKIRCRVLPPVHFEEPRGLEHYGRSRVMDAAEAIRQDLQAALDDLLRRRTSIWKG